MTTDSAASEESSRLALMCQSLAISRTVCVEVDVDGVHLSHGDKAPLGSVADEIQALGMNRATLRMARFSSLMASRERELARPRCRLRLGRSLTVEELPKSSKAGYGCRPR